MSVSDAGAVEATPRSGPGPGGGQTQRSVSIGGQRYPLVLPSLRDPRLHVAAVTLSVHALGQVGLHFRLSIPQILAAVLTCAVIEVLLTFRAQQAIVWPASAMLTGTGVALILRVVGTPPDDPWNTSGLPIFAGVAAFSLLTKYVIKYRGSHIFNPSNVGLVAAFVVLGSTRVEPLDFWWAPLDLPMIAAYVVIIGGSTLVVRETGMLWLSAAFYATLAASTAVLSASGHCMTANWAFAPVCGPDYFRVIVTSPEVLIFAYFMVTDPRIAPRGRVARVVFGALVGVMCALLMAPQTDEFGTKVGLLAGLVPLCVARPFLERWLPEPRSAADRVGVFTARLLTGGAGAGLARAVLGAVLVITSLVAAGTGVVVAGGPARGTVAVNTSEAMLDSVPRQIDPATLPPITVSQSVQDWDHAIADNAEQLLVTLAQNLELENQALMAGDPAMLVQVDHGDRLAQLRAILANDRATGAVTVSHYHFTSVTVRLIVPFGVQTGLSLGLDSSGTVTEETYDASRHLTGERTVAFAQTFAIRRATGARWLDVAMLPPGAGS